MLNKVLFESWKPLFVRPFYTSPFFIARSLLFKVHSTLHGIHYKASSDHCYEISHYVSWKNLDFGIYTWTTNDVLIDNNILADNKIGVFANSFGLNPLGHPLEGHVVTIQNTLITGQTASFDCATDNAIPEHATHYPDRRSSRPTGSKCLASICLNFFSYETFSF